MEESFEIPTKVIDFTLPRDFYTLQAKDLYKNIKENVSYDAELIAYDESKRFHVPCSCSPLEGCGPRCQNRLLYM